MNDKHAEMYRDTILYNHAIQSTGKLNNDLAAKRLLGMNECLTIIG